METDGTDLESMESGVGFVRRASPHRGGRPPGTSTADRRRQIAALLAARGAMSGTEVAEVMGVSESTASRDLAAIKEQWRLEMIEDVDVMVARDLAELGLVKSEAWWTYQQSLEVGDETVTEQEVLIGKDGDSRVLRTTVVQNPKANLSALKLVQSCIEKKREILGLDKAAASASSGKMISFTVRIGDRVLVSESSTVDPKDDILDAEVVELDSTGKALPSGDEAE